MMPSMTYFITGVSRGLGKEMARRLAADGHRVIGTVRSGSSPTDPGTRGVSLIEMDLTDLRGFATSEPIDVVIHNAGVSDRADPDSPAPGLGRLTANHLERLMRVNATGPLLLTQALLPNLVRRSTRRIVFMSSDLGSIASNTTGGRYAYRASKAALNMIARTLAIDLAPRGFTVAAIDPGWVRTDMGGRSAPIGITESASAVLATIASLRIEDSGTFLDRHGRHVPW